MEKKKRFSGIKELYPYLIAIAVFLLLTLIYVNPILEGKQLFQPDIVNFKGMAKEITDYREATGNEALWTNSMFSGMPAYQISVKWPYNVANFFHKILTLGLPRPADMIFLYFAGFFIFLMILRVNPWVALAGAIGFAFSSYHFIILEAGHNSKAVAIAYMAPVMASIIHTFKGKRLTGGLFFAIFMGMQLFANHLQITYYLLWIVLFYIIFEFIQHLREKHLLRFFKNTLVLLAALILAIGINIGNLWATYVYSSKTMRGGSELTLNDRESSSGLSTDYITNWSYGIGETFSLLIPNVKGGATGALGENTKAMHSVGPEFRNFIGQQNHYWGDQPFTSGPVYVGAIVLFFFILALFYVKGPLKWGLLFATLLSIMLAWGKNFMPLTRFFIDFIPGYNKFRAVSMTLAMAEFTIPALAFLGLHQLYNKPELLKTKSKEFLISLGLTAGIALMFYLIPTVFFKFTSQMESEYFASEISKNPNASAQISIFLKNLEKARISIFRADAIRSFIFVVLAAALTLGFSMKKIRAPIFVLLIAGLITLDMWPINKRYLNDSNFHSRRRVKIPYQPTHANLQILEDKDPHFRVLNRTVNTFNETSTSWFHKSLGGYHGAKLQRYQDLIEFHIEQGNMKVINMLNTKYLILTNKEHQPEAHLNPGALGNAWFVGNIIMVSDANEEILAIDDFEPATTAIVHQDFSSLLEGHSLKLDPNASISLIEYQPNYLKYQYNTATDQLAVFSEIYYPEGWKVKINGLKAAPLRVNYVLRGLLISAGSGEIEFEFRPAAYYVGGKIAWAFSFVLLILIGIWFWQYAKKFRKDPADQIFDS